MTAERAQEFAANLRCKSVLAACARHNRLMQMPSGRERIREFWAAHEARMITVPMADLLHGAAKQHHGVGGLKPQRRLECEFALAWTEFDLDRAQRQAERQDVAPDNLEHRLHLVVALLGQVLVAVRQQADRR